MSNLDKLKNLKASAGLAKCPVVCAETEARALLAKLATPDSIIELFDQLQVAQQRIAEITGKYEEVSGWYAKIKTRMLAAEAELARRNAAAGKPVALTVEYSQFLTDILTASGLIYHGKKDKALSERLSSFCVAERNRFTAAQPAALPKEIPASFYNVLYDECGGFVDCTGDAGKIWAAFRKLAQDFTVEGDSDE